MNCLIVGASAGLGRSLSEQAARRGHNVLLVASDSRDLAAMTASLQLEYGVKASYISCRFGGLPEEEAAVVSAAREFGSVDLLLYPVGFAEENDGTVAVSETRMPGATDHIVLPVSHLGMLLSARVARETGSFLTAGRFSLR